MRRTLAQCALLAGVALLPVACRHAPRSPLSAAQQKALAEDGDAYLAGKVQGLQRRATLDRRDFAYAVALTCDGSRVAFTHLDFEQFRLGLWSLEGRGRKLADRPLNGYVKDVEAVAFSPDGGRLVTAGRDGVIRLFDGRSGVPLRQLSVEEPLTAVAFDRSGSYLFVGSAAGSLRVLEAESLLSLVEVTAHNAAVRAIAAAPEGTVYTGGWDKTVAVWSWTPSIGDSSFQPLRRFTFDGYVNDLSIDRSGGRLGLALSDLPAERTPELLRQEKKGEREVRREANAGVLVDAETGRVIRRWAVHEGLVSSAAVSPDGGTLATGGWDNWIYLFDAGAEGDAPVAEQPFGWNVRQVRFSGDGRALAVAAWTPTKARGDSAPALVVFDVRYGPAEVRGSPWIEANHRAPGWSSVSRSPGRFGVGAICPRRSAR